MADFTQSGYVSPGATLTVDGDTDPVSVTADTLTINGEKQVIREWIRRGVLKTVSVVANVNTYYVESTPEGVGKI